MGGAINNRMGCDGHVLRFWTGWLVFFFFGGGGCRCDGGKMRKLNINQGAQVGL